MSIARAIAGGCLSALLAGTLSGESFAAHIGATVTGAEGKPLQDAVVYAVPASSDAVLARPRNAEIDQRNRMFVPAVTVIQTGAAVSFPNSDNIRHQVYSFSPAKVFNTKLYSGRPSEPVVFDKPGIVVLGCNIHDKMTAWVVVVDTPWFGRTDERGEIQLADLPAGGYTLHFWHPGLPGEPLTRQVLLNPDGRHQETLRLDVSSVAPTDHSHHQGTGSP